MLLVYKFSKKNSQPSYLDPFSCIKHPRVVTEKNGNATIKVEFHLSH